MTNQTNSGINEVMAILSTAIVSKPTPLMFRLEEQMRQVNNGFPHWMYHAVLQPQNVMNTAQEEALRLEGFTNQYIPHLWPKHFMRRNYLMKEENVPGTDRTRSVPAFLDYVQGRDVKSQEEADSLLAAPLENDNVSPWVLNHADLPPLSLSVREAPAVTIARLEERTAGARLTDEQVSQVIASGALDTVIAAAVAAALAAKKPAPAKPAPAEAK